MKIQLISGTILLISAVCSGSAAPVLYSFDFTNTSRVEPTKLSFQYLSPSYITGSSIFIGQSSLSNISIDSDLSLFSVILSQTTYATWTSVDVQTTVLEKNDFNQPVTLDFNLNNGPNGPSSYLDRDNTYSQNQLNGSGRITFSVAAIPEPSTVSFLLLAGPVAWLYRSKRRTRR